MTECRAAFYARVSSEAQARDHTIASQLAALRERITADGAALDPDHAFVDDGHSGSSLVRPALERLRDAVAAGEVDRIYLLAPDRLARRHAHQALLMEEFRRAGVEVCFLNHPISAGPEGDLLLQIQGVIAEYERAQILERGRRGRRHAPPSGSARALAFADIPAREAIVNEVRRTLEANGMFDGVHIRLTLTRGVKVTSGMDPRLNQSGPTLIVLADHKPPVYPTDGLALVTSSVRRFPPDCLDPKIHHNNLIQSILAKIEANVAGADDALMLDTRGFIAETNATHLFLVERGRVLTPRVVACPEGITRAAVLELCHENGIDCEERDLSLTEAYRADEMFCSGTMGELAAVTRVDGRVIGDGMPGAMTRRLSDLFGKLTAREGTVVVK